MKKRLLIAGLGDTGVLTAVHLGPGFEVVGISAKACMVSGQELGLRLTSTETWRRDYLTRYGQFRRLDDVRIVHGKAQGIDVEASELSLRLPGGEEVREPYDALVIATGVSNGFWRNDALETSIEVDAGIAEQAERVRRAKVLAVVGGGAAAVSVAFNAARRHPAQEVHLFFSRSEPLPEYHPRVRREIGARLEGVGVRLHAEHRARIPEGFACDAITSAALHFEGSSAAFDADAIVWAVGRTRPNTGFVPPEMLDAGGYVRTDAHFRVAGLPNVFAIGDVAATDPNRSSARNDGFRILAHNLRAWARGDESLMRRFQPPAHRWGSILGLQAEGLTVFLPNGFKVRIPRWVAETILYPLIVRRMIYGGVRALSD